MAIGEIAIDVSALNRDVSALTSALRQVRSEIEGMYEAVRVLDRMWEGPANAAFVEQFNIDYKNMQELCAAIQSLIRCMQNAGASYTTGENQVANIISAIKI